MVDYESYFQYAGAPGRNGVLEPANAGPGCMCSDCHSNQGLEERYRTKFDQNFDKTIWDDEQYLICPPRVLGYILVDKEWAQLQVTNLKEIPSCNKKDRTTEFKRLRLHDDPPNSEEKERRPPRKRRSKRPRSC